MSSGPIRKLLTYILFTVLALPYASAQEISVVPGSLVLPDGTPIRVRLAHNVSSSKAHVGDSLEFTVVKDVNFAGFTIVPAGTTARGSITAVKGRRILGMGGRVSLKLDSVELANGEQIEVSASKEVKGRSRTKLMLGGMILASMIYLPATPLFLLTRGYESTVVKTTELTAKVEGNTTVSLAGLVPSQESSSELDQLMHYLPPRIFDGEGREGDMVNLVFVAQPRDLQGAFESAGWVKTDEWTPAFAWHLAQHGTSDASLPMARFYLFGRVQDYSYALPDPDAIVSRRHHLRIWKTDYSIDGTPIWAAAATHDVAIELAKRGRLINHTIDPDVDAERDFIGADLTETSSVSRQEFIRSIEPVFAAETASGASYHSDSRILLLELRPVTLAESSTRHQTLAIHSGVPHPDLVHTSGGNGLLSPQ